MAPKGKAERERRRRKRRQAEKIQASLAATGANALPTGNLKTSKAGHPPAQYDSTGVVAVESSIRRHDTDVNGSATNGNGPATIPSTSELLNRINAITHPPRPTTPTTDALHASLVECIVATAQPAEFAPSLIRAARSVASCALPAITQASLRLEERQDSVRPEEFKTESDETQPYRSDQRRQHVYRPEADPARESESGRRPWFDDTRYHDHPRPTTRSRSRSPSCDRRRLAATTRERDYPPSQTLTSTAQLPMVNSRVAPIRGGEGHDHFYDYPAQRPAARYVPRVLYDAYGNEYVRTAPREPNPYVVYALPPARGY